MEQIWRKHMTVDLSLFIEEFNTYDDIKSGLFIRINGINLKPERLEQVPYTKVQDLYMTYHVFLGYESGNFISACITNEMLAAYGITKRQLHSDALANSKNIFLANIISLEKLLPIPKEMMMTNVSNIFVVTNTQTVNGASVLFYNDMMETIANIVGGSFYAIPSSIHEFLVFAKNNTMTPEELEAIIQEVNSTCVDPDEQLSDHLYEYDHDTGEFRISL